jgi:hypothetical protein
LSVFEPLGIEYVAHYAPLHYLVFIARFRSLKSKPALIDVGFAEAHFRSMSGHHDVARGFGDYAFLTLDREPRILHAKLAAGFPHIAILVPIAAFNDRDFHLCRYNVAMTRYLRRNGSAGFPESTTNGRYYGNRQIPIALELGDKKAMLEEHYPAGTMIEVLVPVELPLPDDVKIGCFAPEDAEIAEHILRATDTPWEVALLDPPGPYNRKERYATEVSQFVDHALNDPNWRGDGLEFDRV